ncbi:MAG: hypothetical protein LBQ93_01545 [Treponema sp.]|jgi:hypothetical protein|nr:hypothetical protein [Treponema sp.]
MRIFRHFLLRHIIYLKAGDFGTVENFDEALNFVVKSKIKAEVIGQWIYCFTTPLIGALLETIGFWYSFKHEAYIFTGNPKDGFADDETLDEIKARLGYQPIGGNHGKNQE